MPRGKVNKERIRVLEDDNARLRQALLNIKRHQEIVAGSMGRHSYTWLIANKALEDTK